MRRCWPILFTLYLFSGHSFAQTLDEVLCGERPVDELQAEQEARELERHMPPIQMQGNTGWCSAFSATDLLNFHNYRYSRQSTLDFYTGSKLLSPIDGMGAAVDFINRHATYKVAKPGTISISTGVLITDVLNGWQFLNYQGRSARQLPFEPQYRSDNMFLNNQDMKSVNAWLYEAAKHNQRLSSDGKSISSYQSLAKLKGAADIAIAPYVIHEYFGNDKLKFLSTLRKTLYPEQGLGTPIGLALCADNIDLRNPTQNACDIAHAITLVGAYYKGGKCTLRLRNSWGGGWKDKGHTNMAVNDFLKIFEWPTLHRFEHGRSQGLARKYYAVWLGPDHANQSARRTKILGDKSEFLGKLQYHISANRAFWVELSDGFTKDLAGKLLEAHRAPFGNDLVYTGTVTDLGNGQWQPASGIVFKGEEMIYVYRQKMEADEYFTGHVIEKPKGTWSGTSGFYTNAQGKMTEVYQYPDAEGVIRSGPVQDLGDGKFKLIK